MGSSRIAAVLAAVFTVIVWGETFVSTKLVLDSGLRPSDIFFYRFLLAYLFIWFFSPKKLFADSLSDEFRMFLLGVTGGSLYFLAENTALEYSTAANVAILVGSAPIITALLVGCFYKEERLIGRQIVGSLIAFIGMALVVLNGRFVLHINPLGDTLALGAALMWAVYSLILRKTSVRYDVRFITRKVFAYGLVSMAVYFLSVNPLCTDADILSRPVVWGTLVYLGLVASLLCFILWNWALSQLGTVRTTNVLYSQCFITMVVASIILKEIITLMAVTGTIVLTLGMILVLSPRKYKHQSI